MMTDNPILFLPSAVKVVAVVALALATVLFTGLALYFAEKDTTNALPLVVLSILQVCVTGLGLLLLLSFTRTSLDVAGLRGRTNGFLSSELPAAIQNISVSRAPIGRSSATGRNLDLLVFVSHFKEAFRADYKVIFRQDRQPIFENLNTLKMLPLDYPDVSYEAVDVNVSVNVGFINVVVKVPADDHAELLDLANPEVSPPPLGTVAHGIGLVINYGNRLGFTTFCYASKRKGDITNVLEMYFQRDYGDDFLVNPAKRLHGAQSVGVLMRSLVKQTEFFGLPLFPCSQTNDFASVRDPDAII